MPPVAEVVCSAFEAKLKAVEHLLYCRHVVFIDKLQIKPTQKEHTWVGQRTSSYEAENWHNSDKSIESISVYLISSLAAKHWNDAKYESISEFTFLHFHRHSLKLDQGSKPLEMITLEVLLKKVSAAFQQGWNRELQYTIVTSHAKFCRRFEWLSMHVKSWTTSTTTW